MEQKPLTTPTTSHPTRKGRASSARRLTAADLNGRPAFMIGETRSRPSPASGPTGRRLGRLPSRSSRRAGRARLMRLISWNCKGAFHRKHLFAAALQPDILVVPESEKLQGLTQSLHSRTIRSLEWFGSNPAKGLAVVSYGDYVLRVRPSYEPRHRWIVPFSVAGPLDFVLFAVWTLPIGKQAGRYARPLSEALESYRGLMDSSNAVWAGAFNSNVSLDPPSSRHRFQDFVAVLEPRGLDSLYHRKHQCAHGEKRDGTFYLYHQADRGFHINYVFASDGFHAHGVDIFVGSHADWSKRSDHAPLVCDILPRDSSRSPRTRGRGAQVRGRLARPVRKVESHARRDLETEAD